MLTLTGFSNDHRSRFPTWRRPACPQPARHLPQATTAAALLATGAVPVHARAGRRRLWVADQRAPRYSIFAPDGTFIGTRVRRMAWGMITERCTIALDGSYLEWWTRFPKEERSGDMSDIDLLHFHPVRVSPDGEEQDTLPYLEFTQRMTDDAGTPYVTRLRIGR